MPFNDGTVAKRLRIAYKYFFNGSGTGILGVFPNMQPG